jgi:hypothetical protein
MMIIVELLRSYYQTHQGFSILLRITWGHPLLKKKTFTGKTRKGRSLRHSLLLLALDTVAHSLLA